jgi:uncharacterized membrane protein YgcG
MSYTARNRERHRIAVSAVTGVVTVGSLTSIGWLAGAAADDFEQEQAEQKARAAQEQAEYNAALARSQRQTALRERPTRTRVTTRYVTAGGATNAVGAGGTLGSSTSTSSSGGSSGPSASGSSGGSSGPPPPPPPPPPSSGS